MIFSRKGIKLMNPVLIIDHCYLASFLGCSIYYWNKWECMNQLYSTLICKFYLLFMFLNQACITPLGAHAQIIWAHAQAPFIFILGSFHHGKGSYCEQTTRARACSSSLNVSCVVFVESHITLHPVRMRVGARTEQTEACVAS